MNKFLILFCMPHAGMEEWMKTDEATRKEAEDKMKKDWDEWMAANKSMILETAGAGKMTKVTSGSSVEANNDIMLYALVQGEDKAAVAKLFESHPHLGIPGSWIEVMPANVLPSM